MKIDEYLEQNKEEFLKDLLELLKIPSVSTLPEHKNDVRKAAEWLGLYLKKSGFKKIEIISTSGHPLVFAESSDVKNSPTMLLYSHYDVQPPDPLAEWHSDPFKPQIKNKKIYARGAADDKSMTMINLFSLRYFLRNGGLPLNIKVLLEGEEEVGSPSLERFLSEKKNQEKLKCDFVFVSDSQMIDKETPAIEHGLRGIAYFDVIVTGPKQDVHSGLYGGVIQNPANALAYIISQLKDQQGKILIPGIYDRVRKLSKEEKQRIKNQLLTKNVCQETGVKEIFGEKEFSLAERVGARPTLDVHGLWGGFSGEGTKTIIPKKAGCKVSLRLVPHMKSVEVLKKFTSYVEKITPPGVEVAVSGVAADPYWLPVSHPLLNIAQEALRAVFKNPVEFVLSGGSIPITCTFKEKLGAESVMVGYGLPDDNLHGPNEKMDIEQLWKGIKASVKFIEKVRKTNLI